MDCGGAVAQVRYTRTLPQLDRDQIYYIQPIAFPYVYGYQLATRKEDRKIRRDQIPLSHQGPTSHLTIVETSGQLR
jgi:hypothetical protein